MKKHINILGMGRGWERCPYDKETWTFGIGVLLAKRADKVFMFNPIERMDAVVQGFYQVKKGDEIEKHDCSLEIIKDKLKDTEFISAYSYTDVPTYKPYPIKDIIKDFGTDYFVNPICYMIAYALFNEVKSITLYGVDHSTSEEYIYHRACIEFWLGLAAGAGVKVDIKHSMLLNNHNNAMYGYRLPYLHLEEKLKDGELIFIK